MSLQYISYAGIGSRHTPTNILDNMTAAASALSSHGITLRSGGAEGADTAFEKGVTDPELKQIFLPWKGFNSNPSPYFNPLEEAMLIAASYHPNWNACSKPVRLLMARNVHQIFGASLYDPVSFVICWTQGGHGRGGTGQALRIARDNKIPIYDMALLTLGEVADQLNHLLETDEDEEIDA